MRSDIVPVGRLLGTFEQLHAAGCIQTGANMGTINEVEDRFLPLFTVLMIHTQGNMCDGCPAFNNGACKAFK